MPDQELNVSGFDLSRIRNRNEKRVAKLMPEILDQYYEDYAFEQLDIEDIYALALNLLPARYVQRGSIIISDRISDFVIKSKIREATERVLKHPTRSD
ncbi:competence protein ComFB [Pseudodesulfovibrio sp. F-1]|uniref:Competence protein ComFB n=1 Tax=Pseudodesulfovibrio alkaliphilus TaxID=2661613 RepID=A0A7K1KPE9_9BACT|nr:late competence development ComFB family protein [Pseudodesulfovibrio alkaliphilus]MUM77958.1 competence protein ComFB [Pseudodesulfovibrio alkaliphilus]